MELGVDHLFYSWLNFGAFFFFFLKEANGKLLLCVFLYETTHAMSHIFCTQRGRGGTMSIHGTDDLSLGTEQIWEEEYCHLDCQMMFIQTTSSTLVGVKLSGESHMIKKESHHFCLFLRHFPQVLPIQIQPRCDLVEHNMGLVGPEFPLCPTLPRPVRAPGGHDTTIRLLLSHLLHAFCSRTNVQTGINESIAYFRLVNLNASDQRWFKWLIPDSKSKKNTAIP